MTTPNPAASCLIIGALIGALLWILGDSTTAIVIFAAEAVGWAALYALTSSQND